MRKTRKTSDSKLGFEVGSGLKKSQSKYSYEGMCKLYGAEEDKAILKDTRSITGKKYSELHKEWNNNFKNEEFGPFEDLRGEENPRYYTIRITGKLVAGASTSIQGDSTFIHSIASHSKDQGLMILNKIKSKSISIKTMATNPKAIAFFQREGFKLISVPGHYNMSWNK